MAEGVESLGNRSREKYRSIMVAIGFVAMVIFACHASTHMVGAGDTWVAMACGRHFAHHGVDTLEPFSANSHEAGPSQVDIEKWEGFGGWLARKVGVETVRKWHPTGWINQNWLTHLIFYKLVPESAYADGVNFSSNALVYWKFAIYIITVFLVYGIGRVLGVHPALSAVFACAAMFIGRSFLDIRPAGFSNVLMAAMLLLLVLATYRNVLYIWLVVPLTVFWSNVHGGYIYFFIMMVPFIGIHMAGAFLASRWQWYRRHFVWIGWRGVANLVAASAVTLVACILFNPFHLTNFTHTFVVSISEHAEAWRTVNEWHSGFEWSNPVGTGHPFLVMFVALVGVLLLWPASRRLKPWYERAPKNEMEAQRRFYRVLSFLMGLVGAVFVAWTVFLAASWVPLEGLAWLLAATFAVAIVLSVFVNVHFIWAVVALVLIANWTDVKGGYIYGFVTLPAYAVMMVFAIVSGKRESVRLENMAYVTAAAVLSWAVGSYFYLVKPVVELGVTVKDILAALLPVGRLWVPVYEGQFKQDYSWLFGFLYIVNIGALAGLAMNAVMKPDVERTDEGDGDNDGQAAAGGYELPKIDAAFIAVVLLTVYMAVKSRRFIPIAGYAACPLIAKFLQDIYLTYSAARNFHRGRGFVPSAVSIPVRKFVVGVGVLAVVGFGSWWGAKFKHVYLDPWPTDYSLTNVFMRMTASDAKPFYACKFIKDNGLEGKMFNYWTEGGFIAFGQEPDEETGRTPLQLFMDGRAQAAYEYSVYEKWSEIMRGGTVGNNLIRTAQLTGQRLDREDYGRIGKWIDEELARHDVWVVLIPGKEFDSVFAQSLNSTRNWQVVFFNEEQRLWVNVEHEKGRELFDKVLNEQAVFPDEESQALMVSRNMMFYGRDKEAKRRGLAFAIKALRARPNGVTARQVGLFWDHFPYLGEEVEAIFLQYLDDLGNNEAKYREMDGFYSRLTAGIYMTRHLRSGALTEEQQELAEEYEKLEARLDGERRGLIKRW